MAGGVDRQRLGIIAALGTAQTLAWGSSYYLPAILADPIAHDLGISSNWFFAAFSPADWLCLARRHRYGPCRPRGSCSASAWVSVFMMPPLVPSDASTARTR